MTKWFAVITLGNGYDIYFRTLFVLLFYEYSGALHLYSVIFDLPTNILVLRTSIKIQVGIFFNE